MIGKVSRGRRVGGLLAYLFGPGRFNEHTDPRVVGSWAPVEPLQPPLRADGRHDVRGLRAALEAPALLVDGLLGSRGSVWHCSIRAAPGDRTLSDDEWAWAAEQVMDATGLAPCGDDGGVRWVAVRHADDHVHIAAVLARQDGERAHPRQDYARVAKACRAIEARFGLTVAPASDRTAARRPSRAEVESAARAGREPSRTVLRRTVAAVAARSVDADGFVAGLESAGLLVRLRRSALDGAVTGYAVAVPGDRNGDGQPVFYGGSKLAPDLSWGRLGERWADDGSADEVVEEGVAPSRGAGVVDAVRVVNGVARRMQRRRAGEATVGPLEEGPDDVPEMTAALLTAIARRQEGGRGGPLTDAADLFDRAHREPWGRRTRRTRDGRALAAAARGYRRQVPDSAGLAELLAAVVGLIVEVERLRAAQGRTAQAAAAASAAEALTPSMRGPNGSGPSVSAIMTASPPAHYSTAIPHAPRTRAGAVR